MPNSVTATHKILSLELQVRILFGQQNAEMAEMVYALDLGSRFREFESLSPYLKRVFFAIKIVSIARGKHTVFIAGNA